METTKEAILLLELTIARSRVRGQADEKTKARTRGALEEAKHKILALEERIDDRTALGLILGEQSTKDTERAKAQGRATIAVGDRVRIHADGSSVILLGHAGREEWVTMIPPSFDSVKFFVRIDANPDLEMPSEERDLVKLDEEV